MATQEEIKAAYALVYESERSKAEKYIEIIETFNSEIEKLSKDLPDTGQTSALANAIAQARSMVSMYPGTSGNLRAVYGLEFPKVEETNVSANSTI